MTRSRFEPTGRLAERVLDGEVVFFVGSGFSVDSEGNTASRLCARLLAALLAMGTVLADEAGEGTQAPVLLNGLGRIFGLKEAVRPGGEPGEPARCMTRANIDLLAREYYNFNEWCVSALGVLSGELLQLDASRRDHVARRMEQLGTFLLTLVGDTTPLDPFQLEALRAFRTDAARGKALFLDTMGFANETVMAGSPRDPDVERVALSYGTRLRARHHALARLARESLAPAMVTTNYDLLLEGAYRLAGLLERETGDAAAGVVASSHEPRYSSIAGADQFFARGEGYRTSLLLKIHGCVREYRDARSMQLMAVAQAGGADKLGAAAPDRWASYLPALVFTYREIQTWREDAWSRDLIRTMLRTHTLALCGYSGQDPILHSTFREVYEERARARAARPFEADQGKAEHAPVFFFGFASKREFHSLEILRAATEAGGFPTGKLVEHPNLVEFEGSAGFPALDDHFRCLTHCVLRRLQLDALQTHLRRLAPRLLGHPCPDADFEILTTRFSKLCEAERMVIDRAGVVDTTGPSAVDRERSFDAVVGWTWHFVPGFLRELALAELVERSQDAARTVRSRRAQRWYQPAAERPEWAAWAAIVELAIRSLVAAWRREPNMPLDDPARLAAEASPHAAISFSLDPVEHQPRALCIRLAGFERLGRAPALSGAFRKVAYWEFREQDVPWPTDSTSSCPSPVDLWDWAMGAPISTEQAAQHLGADHDRQHEGRPHRGRSRHGAARRARDLARRASRAVRRGNG